ncbi:MAG: hypothetical protein HY248_06645, partial [Fimbriimonas ginsengisoli]|nr:hypothetical protein [Fimbriimonas ginsengisoli]
MDGLLPFVRASRLGLGFVVLAACQFAAAQQADLAAKSHYAGLFAGRSQLILGSEDTRVGGGLYYGYGRPEKRLRFGRMRTQLVFEGYVLRTHSGGANGDPPNDVDALGGLAYAHYRWKSAYLDIGIGLQASNHVSTDLPSYVNSTPMAGAGAVVRSGRTDWLL